MLVNCVYVYIKEEHINDFIEAIIKNHNGTRKEPGNLRFDVLQSKDDPSRFLLYEAFESEEAVAAHKETEHFLKWRDTVAGWMEKPRERVSYNVIRPDDIILW